jgi:hypothetical protein
MSRNRRNFDVDYSEGGAIVPTTRLQGMLNQVQQQGGIVNQQPGISTAIDTQPLELEFRLNRFSQHRDRIQKNREIPV